MSFRIIFISYLLSTLGWLVTLQGVINSTRNKVYLLCSTFGHDDNNGSTIKTMVRNDDGLHWLRLIVDSYYLIQNEIVVENPL